MKISNKKTLIKRLFNYLCTTHKINPQLRLVPKKKQNYYDITKNKITISVSEPKLLNILSILCHEFKHAIDYNKKNKTLIKRNLLLNKNWKMTLELILNKKRIYYKIDKTTGNIISNNQPAYYRKLVNQITKLNHKIENACDHFSNTTVGGCPSRFKKNDKSKSWTHPSSYSRYIEAKKHPINYKLLKTLGIY
jgi:hypothetical protein